MGVVGRTCGEVSLLWALWASLVCAVLACGGAGAPEGVDASGQDLAAHEQAGEVESSCAIAADCQQDPCRLAACLNGRCSYVNRPDATPCDDGVACTTGERCVGGECEPLESTCPSGCETAAECPAVDPTDLCLGRGACVEGACRADLALAVTCEPSPEPCRERVCAPLTGLCVDQARADGAPCDSPDPCAVVSCRAGACVETGDSPCECRVDGDCALQDAPCADRHGCNREVFPHVCALLLGSAVACPDPNEGDCLRPACDVATGVCADLPLAEGAACDDQDPCTLTACAGGACVEAAPSPCECRHDVDCPDDGDLCNGLPRCDVAAFPHVCSIDPETVPLPCDLSGDTDCLHTSCDPATGSCVAVALAAGSACDDGDPCTLSDACDAGGACAPGADLALRSLGEGGCDDANPCTDDTCNPGTGACDHLPVAGFVPCEDPAPCNDGGQCVGALCLGTPKVCDDGEPCTSEVCNEADGLCETTRLTGPACDDHLACTLSDACVEGTCQGTPRACDDGKACTTDACDAETGSCAFLPQPGVPCDDGNACTLGDTCDGTGACVPTSTTTCGKGMCWREVCNPTPGHGRCEAEPDPDQHGQPCYAYGFCGTKAECVGATCEVTAWVGDCCDEPADCDDGDACTTDDCVAHRCTHEAWACDAAEVGCTFTPCEAGACAAPADLGSRRVLFDRTPASADWWQGAYESVEGALRVEEGAVSLSGLVPAASLTLPAVRVPRGTSTLRVRVVQPVEVPTSAVLVASDAAVFPPPALTVRAVDLDDQPGFDVLVDLSSTYDRTRRVSLALGNPDVAFSRVQVVHHGGQGCPGSLDAPAALPIHDTLVYVTACGAADGAALFAWLEAKSGDEGTLAWAAREASGAWRPRQAYDAVVAEAESSFRLSCVAVPGGWALAFGSFTDDAGSSRDGLLRLDPSGAVGSTQPLSEAGEAGTGYPALARLPAGGFVLALGRQAVDGDGWGVFLRAFDDDGTPRGEAVPVNQVTNGDQRAPTLAVGAERVLVAWEEVLGADPVRLKRRLFSTDLAPETADSMFAGSADVTYRAPSAARLGGADGDRFVVVYEAKGKPVDLDPGRGVYRSEFTGEGVEVVNEVVASDVTSGDQVSPFAFTTARGAVVAYATNDAGAVDLVLARLETGTATSWQRLASGVTGYGAVLPAWPGALDVLFWKPEGPGFARVGLTCAAGLYDCAPFTPGLCVDADAYLPATAACTGEGCTPLCP